MFVHLVRFPTTTTQLVNRVPQGFGAELLKPPQTKRARYVQQESTHPHWGCPPKKNATIVHQGKLAASLVHAAMQAAKIALRISIQVLVQRPVQHVNLDERQSRKVQLAPVALLASTRSLMVLLKMALRMTTHATNVHLVNPV